MIDMPKPDWLKKRFVANPNIESTKDILRDLNLNTVCSEAICPNFMDCFARKVATFMILGVHCTRNCTFCNVSHEAPQTVDPDEPARVAEAVARMELSYVVVTSVTRDDLPDGGAQQFAEVVRQIRKRNPQTRIEVLIPDFLGDDSALATVANARPDVISHNMETVKDLYDSVRPGAVYERSLHLLERIKEMDSAIYSKSGIMVGLGEMPVQVDLLMDDLRRAGCEFLTIGQYLAPSKAHHPVVEYISPDDFDRYAEAAYEKGFSYVASSPFVRSSYLADEALNAVLHRK